MRKIIGWVIVLALIGWAIRGCSSLDITNNKEVKEFLKEHTFEDFEYSANMTSFMQFYESSCTLTIFIDGKQVTENRYKYHIGNKDNYRTNIVIIGNEGDWSIKDDGNLYLHNKGETFVYLHKKLN